MMLSHRGTKDAEFPSSLATLCPLRLCVMKIVATYG
jgi:hypothetical protein